MRPILPDRRPLALGGAAALALAALALPAAAQEIVRLNPDPRPAAHPAPIAAPAAAYAAPSAPTHGWLPNPGGAALFGKAVDVSGDRLIAADLKDVWIHDTLSGSWESTGLLAAGGVASADAIHAVAIEGDHAAVAWEANGKGVLATCSYVGGTWLVDAFADVLPIPGHCALQGGRVYFASDDGEATPEAFVREYDFVAGGPAVSLRDELLYPERSFIALASGEGIGGARVVVTLEKTTRTVWALESHQLLGLQDLGGVTGGSIDNGFGDALAVHGGDVWIGEPLRDGAAGKDSGRYYRYTEAVGGGFDWRMLVLSTTEGDELGRALAADGELFASGQRYAWMLDQLLGGSLGVGDVRVRRVDVSGPLPQWPSSGETLHAADFDYTTPDEYGTVVALDDHMIVVGETAGGPGAVHWVRLPPTSQFERELTVGVPGMQGEPDAWVVGLTYPGFPVAFIQRNAVPLKSTWLVLGAKQDPLPFKSGVLLPRPDLLLPLPLDDEGDVVAPITWDTPAGAFTIWGQFWTPDDLAPVGFSGTGGFSMRQDD